ncbi:MAG: isoprenylcysteine carboxylmethyltransferase family protein [Phycisphaerales bacterium]|nr:MAG: isoprenylcysteine carboxylmethyltransferase family protein [Phycisphaerales bacterium]
MATRVSFQGLRYILQRFGLFVIFGAGLFGAAGTLNWPRGWAALAASFACELLVLGILAFRAPETLNQRGTSHAGVKSFDKVFMVTWLSLSLGLAIVMGLDCVRYGWSGLPWQTFVVGIGLLVAATGIGTWAMVENEHFEQCVRIQTERSHRVVTTGPYRIVRHPGYVSLLLSTLAGPLMFGSVWSFVPTGLLVILFVWRTSREDATLQKELDGYTQYTEQTPYRLIPFVW